MAAPNNILAIVTAPCREPLPEYVSFLIRKLSPAVKQFYLVLPAYKDEALGGLAELGNVTLINTSAFSYQHQGLKLALGQISATEMNGCDGLLICNADIYGPVGDVAGPLSAALKSEDDITAPYFQDLAEAYDGPREHLGQRVPYLDFTLFTGRAHSDGLLTSYFSSFETPRGLDDEFEQVGVPFYQQIRSAGYKVGYFVDEAILDSADPKTSEVHVVAQKGAVVSKAAFELEPEVHDIRAVDGRQALQNIHARDPQLGDVIWRDMLRYQKLRDLKAKFGEMAILPEIRSSGAKESWDFGRAAVFIHAFYANMMPEFWSLIEKLPPNFDLFITTATEDNRDVIVSFLTDKGLPAAQMDVRVVEKNRGRDMSSLFITFRDVVLSGSYDVCLRLHSKRTPQVERQVGNSFKAHLFDNLVFNRAFVENLYDYFDAHPNVGLVMPPPIHIGFGTLGHAWFNNLSGVKKLLKKMGVTVPLDEHTPVAPLGTMYWFRAKALAKMFEYPWDWDEYNAEPNHVDGGLAHLQERMIAYVAQDAGYRTISLMNRYAAERSHESLEYKAQLFAAHLPSANIVEQRDILMTFDQRRSFMGMKTKTRHSLYKKATRFYREKIVSRPIFHKTIRPIARWFGSRLRGG